MSGGGNQQVQTTTSTPYAAAQPLLNKAMGDAQTLYESGSLAPRPNTMSTVVPYANQTMQGLNQVQQNSQNALNRNPMDGALNFFQDSNAQGGYNAAQRQSVGGMSQFAGGAGGINTDFFSQLAGGGQQRQNFMPTPGNPAPSFPTQPTLPPGISQPYSGNLQQNQLASSGIQVPQALGGQQGGMASPMGSPPPGVTPLPGGEIPRSQQPTMPTPEPNPGMPPQQPPMPGSPAPSPTSGYGAFSAGAGDINTGRIDQLGQQAVSGNPALMKYNSFSDGAGNIAPLRQNSLADAALRNPAMAGFNQMAGGQDPSVAESNLMNIAQGGYLNRNDPNFEAALSRATDEAANSVNQQASAMGRTGSGTNQGVLAREIGSLQTDARLGQYNQERQNQTNAIGMIDQQRNQGFNNRLGALTGQNNAYGGALDQSLNAANSMASIQSGNQDRILQGIGGMGNTFQSGIGQGLQAAGLGADVQGQNNAMRMAGLGGQLNAATTAAGFQGQNADRQMNAQNALFGQGQTAQNNLAQAGQTYQSMLAGQNAPSQNLMGVGSAFEDLAGRQLNDQLRIAQESNNAPLANIQALLAAAQGAGQYGVTNQVAQGPRNSASNLGGMLLGGGGLLSGLLGG